MLAIILYVLGVSLTLGFLLDDLQPKRDDEWMLIIGLSVVWPAIGAIMLFVGVGLGALALHRRLLHPAKEAE